jgi:selenocysteine lyase/cysteine desulfurase
MVSHVTYVTGLVTPVKELADLAHRRGLLISVDGAHPLGLMDLDLHALGVDHYAAAGQKWLMCGTGTGVCYVKRDVQDRIWELMGPPADPKRGARKYEEFGQRDVPSALGMGAAIDLQLAIGKKNIEARDRALSTRLRNGLKDIPGVKLWTSNDPMLSTGLTLFSVRDIPMANVQKANHEPRSRLHPDDGHRQFERLPGGDAPLQHARGSGQTDQQREIRRRKRDQVHVDGGGSRFQISDSDFD